MGEGKKKVRRKASRREKKDWVAGYVFIAPVTIGLLIFYVFPFIQNFWFSFNDVNKFNMAPSAESATINVCSKNQI